MKVPSDRVRRDLHRNPGEVGFGHACRLLVFFHCLSFQAGGVAGVPADAAAVVVNLTVTEPAANVAGVWVNLTVTETQSDGFLTGFASGTPAPGTEPDLRMDPQNGRQRGVPAGRDRREGLRREQCPGYRPDHCRRFRIGPEIAAASRFYFVVKGEY